MKKILITGGAGYIGSHTIVDLLGNNYEIISIDNFSNSFPSALENLEKLTGKKIHNYNVDLTNLAELKTVFNKHPDISGIIHFAALKYVNESVEEPLKYYQNNMNSLFNLLACCKEFKIENFVFSSSCSVYGNAKKLPVDENTPLCVSESPYAETKVMAERVLQDFARVNPFKVSLLRYFNPIGAHKSGLIGENPKGIPQNVVPRITGTALGEFKEFKVFGTDYDTKDGTCVRDYVHVSDIAQGHTLALNWLFEKAKNGCEVFNMGSGTGVTVLELIKAFEDGSGQKLNYTLTDRRQGDVIAVYADNTKAKTVLNWKPQFSIEEMMKSAWLWETREK